MRRLLAVLAAVLLAVPAGAAPPLRDFEGTFEDTVIQVTFVKVGRSLGSMYIGDTADQRHYLDVSYAFVAEQNIAFSVFGRGDYKVSFWGGGEQLSVKKAEAIDQAAGKGLRLTYSDGTVVEIIA